MALALQNFGPNSGQRGFLTDPQESATGNYAPTTSFNEDYYNLYATPEEKAKHQQDAYNYGARETAITSQMQSQAELLKRVLSGNLPGSSGSSQSSAGGGYNPQAAQFTPGTASYSPNAATQYTPQNTAASGYQALMETLQGQMAGLGGTRRAAIEESSRKSLAAAQGDVQSRGWGNSVLYGAANTAAERDKQVALGALNEQLLGQNINTQASLGSASLQAQAQEADANRQASQFAQSYDQRNAETALQNDQLLRELNQQGSQFAQDYNQRNAEVALQNQQFNQQLAQQNNQFNQQSLQSWLNLLG